MPKLEAESGTQLLDTRKGIQDFHRHFEEYLDRFQSTSHKETHEKLEDLKARLVIVDTTNFFYQGPALPIPLDPHSPNEPTDAELLQAAHDSSLRGDDAATIQTSSKMLGLRTILPMQAFARVILARLRWTSFNV